MYAHNNPNLKCIKIAANFIPSIYSWWWNKDTEARYSYFYCPLDDELVDLGFPSINTPVS